MLRLRRLRPVISQHLLQVCLRHLFGNLMNWSTSPHYAFVQVYLGKCLLLRLSSLKVLLCCQSTSWHIVVRAWTTTSLVRTCVGTDNYSRWKLPSLSCSINWVSHIIRRDHSKRNLCVVSNVSPTTEAWRDQLLLMNWSLWLGSNKRVLKAFVLHVPPTALLIAQSVNLIYFSSTCIQVSWLLRPTRPTLSCLFYANLAEALDYSLPKKG